MEKGFLIQTGGSLVAILALVGLAAWAKIARPLPPLDEGEARRILADEFPDHPPSVVWVSGDGRGAVARAGETALIVYRAGDGYVARSLPWRELAMVRPAAGRIDLRLGDFTAPRARLALAEGASWPPEAP